jgi:predicted MFS family arabinose efflux permease
MLILSRVFAGFCGGTMPVAQAMVMDTVSDFKQRPKYIGICGSMLGVAFTIGPGIGAGVTAATSFRTTFFVTAIISGLITVWAFTSVVETKVNVDNRKQAPKQPWGALVWGPAFALFSTAWAFFVMASMGSLAWLNIYGWGSTELGIGKLVVGHKTLDFRYKWQKYKNTYHSIPLVCVCSVLT